MSYHKLLERQLRRVFGGIDQVPAELKPFLDLVDDAYHSMDDDRLSIERSLDLMSSELMERKEQLGKRLLETQQAQQELLKKRAEQEALIKKLEDANNQLLQSEKMASIGQLAAGIAHEINNPIGFVNSNTGTLQHYVADLLELVATYEEAEGLLDEAALRRIDDIKTRMDLDFLRFDMPKLLEESKDGIDRVRQIVKDLKEFSHEHDGDWQRTDLHSGIDSTLNIVNNEIKYVADVVKEYGAIPEIECLPSQLNQVFLNILVNAAQSIKGKRGIITVRTGVSEAERVFVEIEDNGEGIAQENLKRIYEPFFTTKAVGDGTGLGLAVSYGIISKHGGHIDVRSEVGVGTVFRIVLWIDGPQERAPAKAVG